MNNIIRTKTVVKNCLKQKILMRMNQRINYSQEIMEIGQLVKEVI